MDYQAQHSANTLDSNSEQAHYKQCFNYQSSDIQSDTSKFDELTSTDVLKIQKALRTKNRDKNLISTSDSNDTLKIIQFDEIFL